MQNIYKNKIKPYLGYLKWRFVLMSEVVYNSSANPEIDKQVNAALKTGIFKYKYSAYQFRIVFNNGLYMEGWNANKYYSWCDRGQLLHVNYNYEWRDSRPSFKIMAKLLYQIEQFTTTNQIPEESFIKFLKIPN
jgi:hypothetical protein